MYYINYCIEYFRKCFNDTYNKENGINHIKPTTITGNRFFFTY